MKNEIPELLTGFLRWLMVSFLMFLLLIPFHTTWGAHICGALLVGWFGTLLGSILETLKEIRNETRNFSRNERATGTRPT